MTMYEPTFSLANSHNNIYTYKSYCMFIFCNPSDRFHITNHLTRGFKQWEVRTNFLVL